MKLATAALSATLAGITAAAAATTSPSFLPPPTDTTILASEIVPGATLSYKKVSFCDTTPGVDSYSGYITLPVNANSPPDAYNASLFFWYFTARSDEAGNLPTTIYMPGGPGTSFLDGASGFPCEVLPDGNSTRVNEWAYNSVVNVLYVDTPAQTGFSYAGEVRNGTFDLLTKGFVPVDEGELPDAKNQTFVAGTMGSLDTSRTINTTAQVASQMWEFAQVFFHEFPEREAQVNQEVELWGYSYSGFFGPATLRHFVEQKALLEKNSTDVQIKKAKPLKVGTYGINNGCIDIISQASYYPHFAYNNTYGVEAWSEDVYDSVMGNLTAPGGCYELADECRTLAAELDPKGTGAIAQVNDACVAAVGSCFNTPEELYLSLSNTSQFDISLPQPGVFPYEYGPVFWNANRWVHDALGVAVNYTLSSSSVVRNTFVGTGDPMIRTQGDLEYLVQHGVRVAMVYGDLDYQCNWLGAENVSLTLDWEGKEAFGKAGYVDLVTNATYVGGKTRQVGNVSFSRVYQAGHSVAAYQPETVLQIFKRAIFGKDVATGKEVAEEGYETTGPAGVFDVKNELRAPVAEGVCIWYNPAETCTDEQVGALMEGTAVVRDWVVVEPEMRMSATAGAVRAEKTGSSSSSNGDDSGAGGMVVSMGTVVALAVATMVAVM